MDIVSFWRALAGIGAVGLCILIIVWNGWLTPVQEIPRSIEIALLLTPLLVFLRNILRGQRNAFIVATLLSFVYALIGIWYIYSEQEKIYGYLMLLLSLCLFFGSLMTMWVLDKRDKKRLEALETPVTEKTVKK